MQSSKCSAARDVGPAFELGRFLHSFPSGANAWGVGLRCFVTSTCAVAGLAGAEAGFGRGAGAGVSVVVCCGSRAT
eukprot:4599650-Pleurochrysis_carterae.AAC.1